MRLTMSQEKDKCDIALPSENSDSIAESNQRTFLTKKRIISAIVIILVTAIIVTGIIVGIWIFTENTKLIMQYKLDLVTADNKKATQDVSADADENIVQYHVKKDDKEWWIIQDFKRNVQIAKVTNDENGNGKSICLLSSVDLSNVKKPSSVKDSNLQEVRANEAQSAAESRTIASTPISDRTIIGKTAQTLCKDTAIYWTYANCETNTTNPLDTSLRTKRGVTAPCCCNRYYYNIPCQWIYWYYYYSGGYWYCYWYWGGCYGIVGYYSRYCPYC